MGKLLAIYSMTHVQDTVAKDDFCDAVVSLGVKFIGLCTV